MKQIQIRANITGTGSYLPETILTNEDIEKLVDTTDEWIQSRTGIRERRIARPGETSSEMSTYAINNLMENYQLTADEIDVIIVATITPDMMFPATAALVQRNINAKNAWGYDLSAACSGFLFALQSGACLIASGLYKKVIVVGVDTMSSILDFSDRNTCILFGDGAGAVLLVECDTGVVEARVHGHQLEAPAVPLYDVGNADPLGRFYPGHSVIPSPSELFSTFIHALPYLARECGLGRSRNIRRLC